MYLADFAVTGKRYAKSVEFFYEYSLKIPSIHENFTLLLVHSIAEEKHIFIT